MTDYKKLQPHVIEEIRSLTLAGKAQKEIAAILAIHRNRVYRYQKAMGLHGWWSSIPTAAKEKKILGLLREGVPRKRVEKLTRSTVHAVRRIAEAHGIGRTKLSQNQQVVSDILHRNGSGAAIAKRHGVSYKGVLRLAHELLQCPTFIGGQTKIALDSYLPQKWPAIFAAARETTGQDAADLFVRLVDSVLQKCFNAQFPFPSEYDARFARVILYCLQQRLPDFRSQPQPVLDNFSQRLSEAINTLRESQASQWTN